jgi:hypothetical protein
MDSLANDYPELLLERRNGPCISIYQTTHRHFPQNKQDPIRFRNNVRLAAERLRKLFPDSDHEALLGPLRQLSEDADFWNHVADGLAVLSAPGFLRVYKLQRPVPDRMIVADSFHTKPLARMVQSADGYQILGLTRAEVRLFEGNRDALDEVALAPGVPRTLTDALGEELTEPYRNVATYGGGVGPGMHHGHHSRKEEIDLDVERFFRVIDRAILEHHSRPGGLPLILAALPEYHSTFRRVSHNQRLTDAAIEVNPDAIGVDELRERAWQAIEPFYLARLDGLVESFGAARARELGTADLASAARAALEGRVDKMLIDADRQIPGRIDPGTGRIEFLAKAEHGAEDLLDDLGELVIRQGGEIVIVPGERMPTDSGIAAILRY